MNNSIINLFETEDTEIATFKGYRLFSVDGSDIDLPNTETLRKRFGYSSNGIDKQSAKDLAMTMFDILNKLTMFAVLYHYDDREKRRILSNVDDFADVYKEQKSI